MYMIEKKTVFDQSGFWCSVIFICEYTNSALFQNSLLMLKMYNIHKLNYRFSALAVNFGTQPQLSVL